MMVEVNKGVYYRASDIKKLWASDRDVHPKLYITLDNGAIESELYDSKEERNLWLGCIVEKINKE